MSTEGTERVTAPFGRRHARIVARELHGAYTVLRCSDRAGPRPHAGQFYMLAAAERWGAGEGERPYLPRAFSVLRASASGRELEFLFEDVGPGSKRLCELGPGDDLLLAGPLGTGFCAPGEERRPLLVGGGVGIAPLAIWQDQLGLATTVVVGFRDALHAHAATLLNGARVATDDGGVGHHGLVTELLQSELDRDPATEVYACGPPAMLEAVRRLCSAADIPAQLALEAGMACGFGACYGCVVATKRGYVRLCVDGPVLRASELSNVAEHRSGYPGTGH